MSVLGRAYLGVSLLVFILGLIWFTLVLQENRAWIEIVLLVPSLDFVDPLPEKRFRMNVAAIMAGWGGCVSLLLLAGIYAPFRIRSMALLQRRQRELEREILELRTLPLRQQEEDEILAAEAHLDIRAKKVMTEKLRRDRIALDQRDQLDQLDLRDHRDHLDQPDRHHAGGPAALDLEPHVSLTPVPSSGGNGGQS